MLKFNISRFGQFSDLTLEQFNTFKFSVYVLDFEWNYLFVNDFVKQNLEEKGKDLVGKNMWAEFPALVADPSFILLKKNTEKGLDTNIVTTSPINSQRLNIVGKPLKDCYFFFSTILPNKDELINELRGQLEKGKGSN